MFWRIGVSVVALAVVIGALDYAYGREQLRNPEYLHSLYEQTNKTYFDGQLPDVIVESSDLSEENASGMTYTVTDSRGETFFITLDPKYNTSTAEALDTIQHESCHVQTWHHESNNTKPHGPLFQKCMERFATH
jgi:SprT-like family